MAIDNNKSKEIQKFLDEVQYNLNGVKRYEWIFGETFLSTGGLETTQMVLSKVNLPPGSKILDIGSGTGGHSFYMAEKYGAFVHGVDLSRNMMSVAFHHLSRRPHLLEKVKFEIRDAMTSEDIPDNEYDMVYSRDAFLHIEDKDTLFARIFKWLKPGGKVVFTDYGRGERQPYSDEFNQYLRQRQYHLCTRPQYEAVIKSKGFVDVKVTDYTHMFKQSLERELNKLQSRKEEFLSQFSTKDFEDLESGWKAKLKRITDDDQGWILGVAEKPEAINEV